jgi:serine/threonine protein phosphatase PrpC
VTLSLRYAARSDVGLVRAGNEDSGYAGPRLLVVADGMGGHAAGEVASSIVVASVASLDDDDLGGDLLDALSAAVTNADSSLRRTIDGDKALEGMGTTLTALLWSGSRVGLAHVGDSRAYLLRGGDLLRLTHDHTYVQSLVDEGQITAEEAENHPRRSLLMRAMDGRNPVQPDLSVREVRTGDRFLLCSDGLSGVVSETTIAEELAAGEPDDVAERLVALALRSGAPDNVTVVVADVVDKDVSAPTAAMVVGAAGDPRLAERAAEVVDDSPAAKARRTLGGQAVADEQRRATERADAADAAERSDRRRRWFRRGLIVVVIGALLVAAGAASLAWINTQYYVGVENGQVTVFRGINQQVGTVQLSKSIDTTDLAAATLPEVDRERVEAGIAVADLQGANDLIERLQASAASCALPDRPDGCPDIAVVPTPSPTLTAIPTSPVPIPTPGATP